MLVILEDEKEIEKAQELLEDVWLKESKKFMGKIGHHGVERDVSKEKHEMHYSEKYDVWFCFDSFTGSKEQNVWDVFGVGIPKEKESQSNNITIEINTPIKGINRRVQGVFAKEDDKFYLLRRGHITSSKMNKEKRRELTEKYSKSIPIKEGNETSVQDFVFYECIDSLDFPDKLANFIKDVSKIKNS